MKKIIFITLVVLITWGIAHTLLSSQVVIFRAPKIEIDKTQTISDEQTYNFLLVGSSDTAENIREDLRKTYLLDIDRELKQIYNELSSETASVY